MREINTSSKSPVLGTNLKQALYVLFDSIEADLFFFVYQLTGPVLVVLKHSTVKNSSLLSISIKKLRRFL